MAAPGARSWVSAWSELDRVQESFDAAPQVWWPVSIPLQARSMDGSCPRDTERYPRVLDVSNDRSSQQAASLDASTCTASILRMHS